MRSSVKNRFVASHCGKREVTESKKSAFNDSKRIKVSGMISSILLIPKSRVSKKYAKYIQIKHEIRQQFLNSFNLVKLEKVKKRNTYGDYVRERNSQMFNKYQTEGYSSKISMTDIYPKVGGSYVSRALV